MKTYLIGIDIGTSGCKIAVFNKAGEVLAAQSGKMCIRDRIRRCFLMTMGRYIFYPRGTGRMVHA